MYRYIPSDIDVYVYIYCQFYASLLLPQVDENKDKNIHSIDKKLPTIDCVISDRESEDSIECDRSN